MLQPMNASCTLEKTDAGEARLHSAACDCFLQELLNIQGVLFADGLVFLTRRRCLSIPLLLSVLCSSSGLRIRSDHPLPKLAALSAHALWYEKVPLS